MTGLSELGVAYLTLVLEKIEVAMESIITLSSGHKIWTNTVGKGPGLPLIVVHGGPGAGHDYLEPLGELGVERSVVFYDQLGCGRSDVPDNPLLWTIERFADELHEVRDILGLESCHILGQSWGGWLALEYVLRKPVGLASVVFSSTSASIPEFSSECEKLLKELPEPDRAALKKYGDRGEFDHPEYLAAEETFYKRHLCRLQEWPPCLQRSVANLHHTHVYEAINGPNEFTTIGNLRYWDRTADLHTISTPVMITCGRYDELGPACAETLHSGIEGALMQVFEESAHVAHLEETEKFLECVSNFLKNHD